MRFLCFLTPAGLLALASLLFGFPDIKKCPDPGPGGLSRNGGKFLIFPAVIWVQYQLILKRPGGRITGGFILQKFWPIPLVVLAVIAGGSVVEGGIEMPGWWPLLKPGRAGRPPDPHLHHYAGGGSPGPRRSDHWGPRWKKSRLSALYLSIYSLVLLILAVLSEESRSFAFTAALFSFLGHEAVIYIGRGIEFREKPLYVPPEQGVRVLDVLPDGPAWRADIRSGDVLRP